MSVFIETVGWMNDSEWNVVLKEKNPINDKPLEYKSDYFSLDNGFLYKTANRHIIEFKTMEDAEECLERIEDYRNSEPTRDPFEKGIIILSPNEE